MTDQIANMPTEVEDLAMMACRNVQRVIGVEPDFTHETLPLVDQYLRELPHDSPAEEIEQALATVGCYFGEVARRLLDGRWAITTDPPRKWRVELINCFFHFRPVGMAGEVFYREVSDEYDGAFATLNEQWDGLSQALSEAVPVSEQDYYSLSGRIDVLHLAADWLTGHNQASGEAPRTYSALDYDLTLERTED